MGAAGLPPVPPRPDLGDRPAVPGWPPLRPTPAAPRRRRSWPWIVAAILLALVPGLVAIPLVGAQGWLFGDHGEHAFLRVRPDGSPYRWNPCEPIHYEVNLEGSPAGALADAEEAARRLTDATGIVFIDDGPTDRTPEQQVASNFLGPAPEFDYDPVLIAWEHADEFERWAPPRQAAAIGIPRPETGEDSWIYRSGMIVVNADTPMATGFEMRYSLGPVLMHEWGHVMGLGHVGDADELMWSRDVPHADALPEYDLADWGPGDLEGLELLGRDAGCIAG
jgi:hypothetical protein